MNNEETLALNMVVRDLLKTLVGDDGEEVAWCSCMFTAMYESTTRVYDILFHIRIQHTRV